MRDSINSSKIRREMAEENREKSALLVDTMQHSDNSFSSEPPSNSFLEDGRGREEESTLDSVDETSFNLLKNPLGFFKNAMPPIRALKSPAKVPTVSLRKVRFRRKNKLGLETTPLTDDSQNPSYSTVDVSEETRQRAASARRKMVEHIQCGEVLLQSGLVEDGTDRMSRRQQAQDCIRKQMDFTLTQCLLAIVCYMAVAVVAYSFVFENWSIIDSIYFCVVVFSTVGYGDLAPSPTKLSSQIFTGFFALSSIACLGIAIGVVGNNIVEAQEKAMERARSLSDRRVMSLFSRNGSAWEGVEGAAGDESHSGRQVADETSSNVRSWTCLVWEFMSVVVILVVFGLLIAQDPSVEAARVPYFLLITSTTVGLGDVVPSSTFGRATTALFIPLVVGAMGRWLSIAASWMLENRQSAFRRHMEGRELTYEDLDVMDEDGDGHVTRAEFLEFMLVAMDKVDRDFIEEMRRQFSKLDSDGTGVLSKLDLIENARRKLKDPARKLELAKYKAQLLEHAASVR